MSHHNYQPDAYRREDLEREFFHTFEGFADVWCSAPGRTELGGNHTDHQGGHVLAAAVDLDMLGCARANGLSEIRVLSAGHAPFSVALGSTRRERPGTSASLVQGMAALLTERGYDVGGADICLDSRVPAGSGLSSSAAFEVLIGQLLNQLFCGGAVTQIELAQLAQRAENAWFRKPCGLMDQAACALGGVVAMDLGAQPPVMEKLTLDANQHGYTLCIVNVGADHADLTDAYAAIPAEMGTVARHFSKTRLRDVAQEDFWAELAQVRKQCGDRSAARAAHYFAEDARAIAMADAVRRDDFDGFLGLVDRSGRSSALYLQNIYDDPGAQSVTLALAYAEHLLGGKGAVRVHGGGFAGTIQAWVPLDLAASFRRDMEQTVGLCHVVTIRDAGAVRLD